MGSGTWVAIGAIGLMLLMMVGASAPPLESMDYLYLTPENTDRTYHGFLHWGTLYPGYNATQLLTFENGYPSNIRLQMTPDNWQPEHAGNWLHLTWNSEDVEMVANTTRAIAFHLYAPRNITAAEPPIEHFSFDILVTVICEDCVIEE